MLNGGKPNTISLCKNRQEYKGYSKNKGTQDK